MPDQTSPHTHGGTDAPECTTCQGWRISPEHVRELLDSLSEAIHWSHVPDDPEGAVVSELRMTNAYDPATDPVATWKARAERSESEARVLRNAIDQHQKHAQAMIEEATAAAHRNERAAIERAERAEAALARVRKQHNAEGRRWDGFPRADRRVKYCTGCNYEAPCPTIRALDGADS